MIEVTEGVLTAGIVTAGGLLVALCTLVGVIVKMRGDKSTSKEATVEVGTKTLLEGLGDEVKRLTQKHDELDTKFKALSEQFDALRGQLREKMRAVGRILLHLDRHMEQPPDLAPIQDDLDYLSEDGVVPLRWPTHLKEKP